MKYAVIEWVVIADVLHKPPAVIELKDDVAEPLVARGVLNPMPEEAPAKAGKAKADATAEIKA